jgi:hypothetical protein
MTILLYFNKVLFFLLADPPKVFANISYGTLLAGDYIYRQPLLHVTWKRKSHSDIFGTTNSSPQVWTDSEKP